MNTKIPYGAIIKNIRNRFGITQEALADKIKEATEANGKKTDKKEEKK